MEELINNTQANILAVTSGKGGVGKSIATVNIAEMLTYSGYRVAVIDADAGLSNCATLVNKHVSATISGWVNGECYLEDLPHEFDAFTLIVASNEPGMSNIQAGPFMSALDQVSNYLMTFNDFILIDTPAGAGEITLWSLDQADIGLLVLVDEPTAISDAYRLCKYVYSIDPHYPFANIVNFSADQKTAQSTNDRFNNILNYFLGQKTEHFGFLPTSNEIRQLVASQHTLLHNRTAKSQLEKEFMYICQNIIGHFKKDFSYQNKLEQII